MATCRDYLVRLLEAYGVEIILGIPGVHRVELVMPPPPHFIPSAFGKRIVKP